ncbi:MAG: gliding motility protein GldN [Bacteroidales bacterium]|nr:gliding motility protein GldN [Bacteroidales bacterium]
MKRIVSFLSLIIVVMTAGVTVRAQSVVDSDDEHNFNNFYEKTLRREKRAMPYAFLRQSDVVWETCIWRTIDFRERFNQFFFFPTDPNRETQGRVNLVNCIMKALENGDIEVFEDDEMKIPKEFASLSKELHKEQHIDVSIRDEWDEVIDVKDSVIYVDFDAADVLSVRLKEFWYIDKQDTRQKVRIVGLSLIRNSCRDRADGRECTSYSMFWVPMNDMRVRNVLVKAAAYDENNNVAERSYDDIFISRYFDSFVTRETNRFNRSVQDYLTGTDAILESQQIEDRIFDIESDMWEY